MTVIKRAALVRYSAAEMYALVADIPSYPQFLPWCAAARLISRGEDVAVAAIDVRYGGLRNSFTTRNVLQKDAMMDMQLVDGPFSHFRGCWRFHALDDRSCKVSLDLDFAVSKRMLSMMFGPVFTRIANQLVESFHQRATELYGART